jgi:hypothetical protein
VAARRAPARAGRLGHRAQEPDDERQPQPFVAYYSSTAWGAWAFQDVFDIRFYETMARRFADAVEQAAERTVPVRVSARTGTLDALHRNSMGPSKADDGTPAGYPHAESEHTFTVVRFDDVSSRTPKPLAVLLNYSGHPEFLEGNNLLSADYLGPLERFIDRETGATTVFTQNAVGTAEPERSSFHDFHQRLEFTHREYAQAELGARILADAVVGTWRAIGAQDAGDQQLVPWMTSAPVQVSDRWFPGPPSHPYPSVSNCRTEPTLEGSVGIPVIGLPDCNRDADASGVLPDSPYSPGLPLPSNSSVPSYGALQETLGIHLQALRIGDVLFTFCSCEQWKDQSRNIQTRTDKTAGNEWLGYDWSDRCAPADSVECRRMRAQVHNDASGWNDPEYVLQAETEPEDPEQIKGNYTHDDTAENAKYGYALTVPVSMANDYNGYIATYREYQRGDHYRKALTAFGPHSSDYMATRLANMGRALRGSPDAKAELDGEPLNHKQVADQVHADAKAAALGAAAQTALTAYERALPDDGGSPEVLTQPSDVERFAGAHVRWRGGDNYVDDPRVVVQRKHGKSWVPAGDQSGEVVTTVKFPAPEEAFSHLTGNQEWEWTATWETFAGRAPSREATPPGTYRFVVSGSRRTARRTVPYALTSSTFTVRPWGGITVEGTLEDGRPVFRVGPGGMRDGVTLNERRGNAPIPVRGPVGPIDYPDSYGGSSRASSTTGARWSATRPRRTTRPSGSGTAWTARSGRGWMPATPSA